MKGAQPEQGTDEILHQQLIFLLIFFIWCISWGDQLLVWLEVNVWHIIKLHLLTRYSPLQRLSSSCCYGSQSDKQDQSSHIWKFEETVKIKLDIMVNTVTHPFWDVLLDLWWQVFLGLSRMYRICYVNEFGSSNCWVLEFGWWALFSFSLFILRFAALGHSFSYVALSLSTNSKKILLWEETVDCSGALGLEKGSALQLDLKPRCKIQKCRNCTRIHPFDDIIQDVCQAPRMWASKLLINEGRQAPVLSAKHISQKHSQIVVLDIRSLPLRQLVLMDSSAWLMNRPEDYFRLMFGSLLPCSSWSAREQHSQTSRIRTNWQA